MASIVIHFDGEFAQDHQISIRTLSKSISSLQSAIDRAHLDISHGGLYKNARIKQDDYLTADFLIQLPEEGGFKLKSLSKSLNGRKIIDRITSAIMPAYELSMDRGLTEITEITESINERKQQINNKILIPQPYEDVRRNPDSYMVRPYGDRSIAKEIDQMLSPVRAKKSGESTIELVMNNDEREYIFNFSKNSSHNFHRIVAHKIYGKPIIFRVTVVSLENKNLTGKVKNVHSKKESHIFFSNQEDFLKMHPFLAKKDEEVQLIGCPIIEYGAFDIKAGDIFFLDLWPKNG
jgi:hypothetical protein